MWRRGEWARGLSGNALRWRLIGQRLQISLVNLLKTNNGLPIVWTGDMNSKQQVFCRVTKQAGMVSASGGYRSATRCKPPRRMVVDWIFGSNVQFSNYVQDRSRKVARTTDHHMLVTDALVMAVWRRSPQTSLLHHSDQGSQYTSEPFQRLLTELGVTCSMSRSGNVWDNSVMESFFSSLKTERVNRRSYLSRDHARQDIFEYIERFYNPRRRHSTLNYLSPVQFEQQVVLGSAA